MNNFDIVLDSYLRSQRAAVTQDGWTLKFADDSLKKNYDIVLAAVTQHGYSLYFADEILKDDEHFLSTLIHEGIDFANILLFSSNRIQEEYEEDTLRNLTLHIKGAL